MMGYDKPMDFKLGEQDTADKQDSVKLLFKQLI